MNVEQAVKAIEQYAGQLAKYAYVEPTVAAARENALASLREMEAAVVRLQELESKPVAKVEEPEDKPAVEPLPPTPGARGKSGTTGSTGSDTV